MILERLTQIEAKITRLFNQFSIDIQHEIVFFAHLHSYPSACDGKFNVISLIILYVGTFFNWVRERANFTILGNLRVRRMQSFIFRHLALRVSVSEE